mmetsp:Transcript_114898/g.371428  ORF Transcript_114898/g.371428 Transcript_114898/m.371428 type:complete len:519 (+) Transcript_114898:50-1606(+)
MVHAGHGHSDHGHDTAAKCEDQPVRPGRIRLYGDFVGTVTTEDHYLEVALPLNCELPIAAFETVIAAIVAEHASRRNGDAQSELEQRTGKVWEDLKVILTSSSSSPSGAGVGKMHTSSEETIMPSVSQTNSFKRIISEEDMDALWRAASHEKALEIDYAAKEALVLELRKERDGLKQELERLREGHGDDDSVSHRGGSHNSSSFRRQIRRRTTSTCNDSNNKHPLSPSSSSSPVVGPVKEFMDASSAPSSPIHSQLHGAKEYGSCNSGSAAAPSATDLEEGAMWLDGSFSGSAMTKQHFLEIVLPIKGFAPGIHVLEVLHGLGDAAGSLEHEAGMHAAKSTWKQLATLLAPEYGHMGDSSFGARGRSPPPGPDVQPPQHDAHAEDVKRSLVMLEQLRAENARIKAESEKLKAKNTSLVSLLASAEVSAMQLRTTLRHAGGPLGIPSRDLVNTTRRAGSRSPSAGSSRASTPSKRPKDRGSYTPRPLAAQDERLVADLRELERWAHELRTLEGSPRATR